MFSVFSVFSMFSVMCSRPNCNFPKGLDGGGSTNPREFADNQLIILSFKCNLILWWLIISSFKCNCNFILVKTGGQYSLSTNFYWVALVTGKKR